MYHDEQIDHKVDGGRDAQLLSCWMISKVCMNVGIIHWDIVSIHILNIIHFCIRSLPFLLGSWFAFLRSSAFHNF
jgi:hypothetical protein